MKRFVVGCCIAVLMIMITLQQMQLRMFRQEIADKTKIITDLSNGKNERCVASNVTCTSGAKWPVVVQLTGVVCK